MPERKKRIGIFWRALKSFICRSADLFYAILPKRAVLRFYSYLTYVLRTVTWRLACKYYGPAVVKYRGGIDEFILSQIKPGDRVLDVGCAEGHLSGIVAVKARSVVGVDIDKNYIENIDKDVRGLKNVEFITGDVLDLEFEEPFDVAVMVHAIEHMEKSDAILKKLSALARNIVVETPSEESDWVAELLEDMDIEDIGDDKHIKLYNDNFLKDELEQSGWTDVVSSRGPGVIRAVARSKTFQDK
ncbi:MAG: class I SAM-dependent methyltransferase [Candidatus Omnitrophica bacterium]|nr:class I SAM-dependent methyltransferase [Candidatus Omnitrophota bacterium]